MEIVNGELIRNETNKNAMGGTELMAHAMVENIQSDLFEGKQIIHSRVREIIPDMKHILVLHDLPNDPESQALKDRWDEFDRVVCVSNWQLQMYNAVLQLPYSKSVVVKNAINPLKRTPLRKKKDKIRLIYHTTPHRGLNILYAVFDRLCRDYPDQLELDVYSSFKIYGWGERDDQYSDLFAALKAHPNINYHGSVSNKDVRAAISTADIFAYPSIWPETSCISLIEAMSAGLLCVHPNYAALPETSANWTMMYQWHEDVSQHANIFYECMHQAIKVVKERSVDTQPQSMYTNVFYDWKNRTRTWEELLVSV